MKTAYPKGKMTAIASRWQMFKARLFGKKYVEHSGPYTIVMYYYQGIWYLARYDAL